MHGPLICFTDQLVGGLLHAIVYELIQNFNSVAVVHYRIDQLIICSYRFNQALFQSRPQLFSRGLR